MQFFTHNRKGWSILPWCSAITPASSGATDSRCWYHVSLMPRVLININVLRCFQIRANAVRQFQSQVTGPGVFFQFHQEDGNNRCFSSALLFTNTASHGRLVTGEQSSMASSRFQWYGEPQTVSLWNCRRNVGWVVQVSFLILFHVSSSLITILLIASYCTPRFDPSSSCHSSTVITCRFSNRASWFCSQQQMQAFRRDHQHFRHLSSLLLPFFNSGIAIA